MRAPVLQAAPPPAHILPYDDWCRADWPQENCSWRDLTALGAAMLGESFLKSPRSRFVAAIALAVAADIVQIAAIPLFAEGAISPLDDLLDVAVMAVLIGLLGWNWEFLPSFIGELVPGLDLVPFWTLAVASVYRKWKHTDGGVRQIDIEPLKRDS